MRNKQASKLALKCQRCLHEWIYRGENPFFTLCPHCRTTVRTTRNKNTPNVAKDGADFLK